MFEGIRERGAGGAITTVIFIVFIAIGIVATIGIINVAEAEAGEPCNLDTITGVDGLCGGFQLFGFPNSFLNTGNLIWYVIVPMVGITYISYGFLSELMIFRRHNINVALSIMFALATVPLGWFTVFVSVLFALAGVYSVVAFFAIFTVGVFALTRHKIYGLKQRYRFAGKDIREAKNLYNVLKKKSGHEIPQNELIAWNNNFTRFGSIIDDLYRMRDDLKGNELTTLNDLMNKRRFELVRPTARRI